MSLTDDMATGQQVHDSAATLAKRLDLPELAGRDFGRWQLVVFAALLRVLDRLDALEQGTLEQRVGDKFEGQPHG